jgi:hypothetical protein
VVKVREKQKWNNKVESIHVKAKTRWTANLDGSFTAQLLDFWNQGFKSR